MAKRFARLGAHDMKVIGLAGWSGAGKTTLLRGLIPYFRDQGLRVSVIKHAHHSFDVDVPGKDSWLHRQAGAAEVLVSSGLRWALMGPILTFHLASGNGGIGSMLDHFGPALLEPWTRLQAPPLTAELRERLVEGCAREAAGRSVAELERERDDFLVGLLALVEGNGDGR